MLLRWQLSIKRIMNLVKIYPEISLTFKKHLTGIVQGWNVTVIHPEEFAKIYMFVGNFPVLYILGHEDQMTV